MGDFEIAWRRYYGACQPIGYLMREAGTPHWVRFHSLPDSKRYADTAEQWTILLARQNALATEVLGDAPCWMIQSCWQTPAGVVDIANAHDPFRTSRDYELSFDFQFSDEDKDIWNVNAALMLRKTGLFDEALKAIADDRAAPTLWMSSSTGAVFAPYDGGCDLFLQNQADVDGLRGKYGDWLSAHPAGL